MGSGVLGAGGVQYSAGLGMLMARRKVRGAALAYIGAGLIHFPLMNGLAADGSGQDLAAEVAGAALVFHQPAAGGVAGGLGFGELIGGRGDGPGGTPAVGADRCGVAVVSPAPMTVTSAVGKDSRGGGGDDEKAGGKGQDTFHGENHPF